MNTRAPEDDEMQAEYDFSHGKRGRLAKRMAGGYDIVIDGNEDHPIHVSAEEVRAGQGPARAATEDMAKSRLRPAGD